MSAPKGRSIACGLLVILLFAELVINAKAVRLPRNDMFATLPDAVQYVKDRAGLHRTLNFGQTGLYPELGSAIGVQEISSMNPGSTPAYLDFFYSAVDLDLQQRVGVGPTYPRGAFPSLFATGDTPEKSGIKIDLLSFLGVKYILLPADFLKYREWFIHQGFNVVFESPATTVLENPRALPRAFMVSAMPPSSGFDIEVNTRTSAIVPANITAYRNASVEIDGVADDAGVVVLTDAWHPYWSATVNGAKVESVLRVSGTFRGIPVPHGPYQIKLEYRPPTLTFALISFSTGIFLTAILLFAAFLRSHRSNESHG